MQSSVGAAYHVHQFRDFPALVALSSVSVIANALRLARVRLD
jgi:hypothetical protein